METIILAKQKAFEAFESSSINMTNFFVENISHGVHIRSHKKMNEFYGFQCQIINKFFLVVRFNQKMFKSLSSFLKIFIIHEKPAFS